MDKCPKCAMPTDGYKCEECGVESAGHDENHSCGGSKCVPKCSGCNQAHTQCSCA